MQFWRPIILIACLAGLAGADDKTMNDIKPILATLSVRLEAPTRPAWPTTTATSLAVRLLPQSDHAGKLPVSFAVPLPPDFLTDPAATSEPVIGRAYLPDTHPATRVGQVCPTYKWAGLVVTDADGKLIPAFTKPLVYWWTDGRRGAIRSMLVQFELDFPEGKPRTVTIRFAKQQGDALNQGLPAAQLQDIIKKEGYDFHSPKVLAVLEPEWLCQSLLAWQQVPAAENTSADWYDKHLLATFPNSLKNINARDFEPHLYDRPTTYAKVYIRHGQPEQLLAAMQAADFYIQHLGPDGFFTVKGEKDCKYVYTEGSALMYMLTGDERYRAAIDVALKAWPTWTNVQYRGRGFWTERHTAFGMAAYLHAYEITGRGDYLAKAREFFEGVLALQIAPLDGKPADGAWVHTGESHTDGNGWTTSPWMSALLCDSIWKYWMLSGDQRAAASLAMYAKFLQKYGVRPDGKSTYYMANSPGRGQSIDNGAPSPSHNVEACYMLAMGYWLSGGKDAELLQAYQKLWPEVLDDGANRPARKFNWRFRESSMMMWFLQNTPQK